MLVSYRLKELQKEYDTLKENDPAELQKAVSLTEVGWCLHRHLTLADLWYVSYPVPMVRRIRASSALFLFDTLLLS